MPRTYATGDRLALLAWATAQKLPAHPAGKTLTSARACEVPRRRVPPSCRRGSPGRDAGGVDRLRHPTRPAPISLQPRSISSGWRYQRDDSGDTEWRSDRGRYERECVAQRLASARASWPRDQLPSSDRKRQFEKHRNEIVLRPAGDEPRVVRSSPSLWRNCSELRSANISRIVTR